MQRFDWSRRERDRETKLTLGEGVLIDSNNNDCKYLMIHNTKKKERQREERS